LSCGTQDCSPASPGRRRLENCPERLCRVCTAQLLRQRSYVACASDTCEVCSTGRLEVRSNLGCPSLLLCRTKSPGREKGPERNALPHMVGPGLAALGQGGKQLTLPGISFIQPGPGPSSLISQVTTDSSNSEPQPCGRRGFLSLTSPWTHGKKAVALEWSLLCCL
jgi:hypothetical protein